MLYVYEAMHRCQRSSTLYNLPLWSHAASHLRHASLPPGHWLPSRHKIDEIGECIRLFLLLLLLRRLRLLRIRIAVLLLLLLLRLKRLG